MNLKRLIWITKCVGIYADFCSNTISNIPDLPKYEDKRNANKTNKNSFKREPVRSI